MIKKILIANRGEIALRILRACHELNIQAIAIYSTIDKNLMHVKLADSAICIGPEQSLKSYLNIPAIIAAAEISGADAIHPGYGFLSENYEFAESVESSGLIFIGPHYESIRLMGDKINAIKTMKQFGMPCIPGYCITHNMENNITNAKKLNYPIMIKAAMGGGGKGIKIAYNNKDLIKYINIMQSEAKLLFNNNKIYMEKLLIHPKHIEIQILGDGCGNAIHLYQRDCSIQRKYQKLIEEAPVINVDQKELDIITKKCVEICKKLKYRSTATFEFLYENKNFYFIEINTRIQVEHPITELITNIDLIKEQINIAQNNTLSIKQNNIKIHGYSIECRINAEDSKTFLPCPGKINMYHAPGGPGVRIDSHIYSSYCIPSMYDSMIAKIIVHAKNRKMAIIRMQNALKETIIDGIKTNISLHQNILNSKKFQLGTTNVNLLNTLL